MDNGNSISTRQLLLLGVIGLAGAGCGGDETDHGYWQPGQDGGQAAQDGSAGGDGASSGAEGEGAGAEGEGAGPGGDGADGGGDGDAGTSADSGSTITGLWTVEITGDAQATLDFTSLNCRKDSASKLFTLTFTTAGGEYPKLAIELQYVQAPVPGKFTAPEAMGRLFFTAGLVFSGGLTLVLASYAEDAGRWTAAAGTITFTTAFEADDDSGKMVIFTTRDLSFACQCQGAADCAG